MDINDIKEKYNKFIIKKGNDKCWDWKGCCPAPGYCQLRLGSKIYKAHRLSWIIHHGLIPAGMHILHKCDNKRCSNPNHLFIGTEKDNMNDCRNKNRTPLVGTTHPNAVLTEYQVIFIKELLNMGVTNPTIAKMFSLQCPRISDIKCGRTWKHV